jgi:Protein of unknown function (DUF3040)
MTTHVDAEIARMEHALHADDPAFLRRCRRLVRRDRARFVLVVVLLTTTALCFAVGLVAGHPLPWVTGLATFALAHVADTALADP